MSQQDRSVVHVDRFLPHRPDRVWRVLVDPDLLSAWFMPTDFKPVVGHRFTFRSSPIEATGFSGVVPCEVLDLLPLQAEGRGTRLFVEHRGFYPDDPVQQLSRTIMNGGWRSHVVRRLAQFLDKG